MATHQQLWHVCRDKEEYESGIAYWSDCSAGCYHFHPLIGKARYDWGVCTNPHAPRAGLLTFEHMGCEFYESEWHQMGINHRYNRADATRQSRKPWRPCARWWNRDMTDLMDRMQALNDPELDPTWPFEAYDPDTQETIWTWFEALGLDESRKEMPYGQDRLSP